MRIFYALVLTAAALGAVNAQGNATENETDHGGAGSTVKHGDKEHTGRTVKHGDKEHAVHHGGHLNKEHHKAACEPIKCEDKTLSVVVSLVNETVTHTALFHDPTDKAGCRDYNLFNYYKNETEVVRMTCKGCTPRVCAHGEHDCVPVYCDVGGVVHGGHDTDPCEQGHHGGDGLSWWPFLLLCLVLTVCVTVSLRSLGNGACCGKSISLPFTVVMFFLGYLISSIVVKENDLTEAIVDAANEHEFMNSKLLFDSVLAWKEAHPHVILFVLLPPLLFEDASGMDYYVFRKVLASSVILAGPGVGVTMGLCALTTMLFFGFANECIVEVDHETGHRFVVGTEEWSNCTEYDGNEPPEMCTKCDSNSPKNEQLPVSVHLLLGGMLAATDPVAVCAVLNDLGCPDKLNFMIAGESLSPYQYCSASCLMCI